MCPHLDGAARHEQRLHRAHLALQHSGCLLPRGLLGGQLARICALGAHVEDLTLTGHQVGGCLRHLRCCQLQALHLRGSRGVADVGQRAQALDLCGRHDTVNGGAAGAVG
jgi:hypothetical protein